MMRKLDPPSQKQPAMTSKEALAVLHKIYDAVGHYLYREEASQEEQRLRKQVYQAFSLLDGAIHGKNADDLELCQCCYLRFALEDLIIRVRDRATSLPCCVDCLRRLQAEHTITRLLRWDTNTQNWVEVPAC
jgi:hypothetical protein